MLDYSVYEVFRADNQLIVLRCTMHLICVQLASADRVCAVRTRNQYQKRPRAKYNIQVSERLLARAG